MTEHQKIQWTSSQQQAIETLGRKVLVTASAGTGKTAVLSRRVVERIADASDPVQANTMLVLTFTDAAAEEMRSRIAETLYKRYLETHDPRLRQQLLLLDQAYISTIHAFCKRVITEFFYLIELDPSFGILDADEQKLLKSELLEEMLEQAWSEKEFSADLEKLFAGRRVHPGTRSFIDLIIPLTEYLDSVVSRDDFYSDAASLCRQGSQAHPGLVQAQQKMLLTQLNQCHRQLEFAIDMDQEYCAGQYASTYIREKLIPAVEQAVVLLEQERFDLCGSHISDLDFGRMPNFKKDKWPEHAKDLIKTPVDGAKDRMKKLADFSLLCSCYQSRLAPQAALQTQVLLKLMALFDAHYKNIKQSRNVLDFSDLEHHVLDLLSRHPRVADILRERFEYIFVDEYQDINAPQQQILEMISRPDNTFVVGDVKQSIYGFRQSKPDIFLSQLNDAQAITTTSSDPGRVDLRDNFRCRPEVIDFVNALFRQIMTGSVAQMDYDDRAALVNGFHYPNFDAREGPHSPIELVVLDEQATAAQDGEEDEETSASLTESVSAAQRQAGWIAKRIQKIVGAETGRCEFQVYDKKIGGFRDVQYRDIVILMRSLSHKARDYTEMLRLAGVPVHSQSACGYFETTEIADCVSLLKVLDNPDRDIELAALLRSPVFGVTDTELSKIRLHAGKQDGFYRAVSGYAASGAETSLAEKLNRILSTIHTWRQQVRMGSLADFLDVFFRQTGLLSFYAAQPNGSQRCANLLKLHDHAIQFEHFRTTEPGSALVRFVQFLQKLDEAEQDWAPAEPGSSSENAVRLMSIHKSKGLEFPVVFAAELNSRFNMRDSAGECLIDEDMLGLQIVDGDLGVRFPSMAHQIIVERKTRGTLAEEMRILYVALTRAREKLILTGSKKTSDCQKILGQCTQLPSPLPDWKLVDMRCHLDWILAGMAKEGALHTLFETGVDGLDDRGLFYIQRVDREQLDAMTQGILHSKQSLKRSAAAPASGSQQDNASEKAYNRIGHNLGWNYGFSDVTGMPAKLSVSELTHRDDEFSAVNIQRGFSLYPQAMLEKGPVSSASADALSLGSAFHKIIEHLDLTLPVDENAVQSTLHRLTETGQLSPSLEAAVDSSAIITFFESSLGKKALTAGDRVLREWPFTYALDGSIIGVGTPGESVILQGIVDMIIPTSEGLVIVDFKTDRVTENAIDERASKYAGQLRHYARASCDILKQPLSGAWLYFLVPGKAIQVDV